MKKQIYLLTMVLCLIFTVLGCQAKTNDKVDSLENKEAELKIISAVEVDPRTSEYATKLSEFAYDFDLDNEEEKVELYTVARRDEKGNMLWDDGQNWLLVVADKDKYYPLFMRYVQIGQLYFSFSTIGEEKTPVVTAIIIDHCGMQTIDYVYNREKEYFQEKTVYEASDRNVFFNSIPNY